MYYVGIDISKYKHDCFITNQFGEIFFEDSISNNQEGFAKLIATLDGLDHSQEIRIGFESTGHYGNNLKLCLENAQHSFSEYNPVLLKAFAKGLSLRKTKTDKIDARTIARFLMTAEYKPHTSKFYHMYSLKSLTRHRNTLVKQRSLYLVKITNLLDHVFPEFKPFFGERISKTALHILKKYGSAHAISRMNIRSYDELRCISRGKFTTGKFFALKDLAKATVGHSNELLDFQLQSVLRLYQQLVNEVDDVESKIVSLVSVINPPILSIKGVGSISAAIILSEFGDVKRFNSPNAMLAFAGMEPAHYQSGQSEQKGRMVKRGSSLLRYALMNIALPVVQHNFVFAEYYNKKRNEGKPHRVALSHVCKKLIRVIYTLEAQSLAFDPNKLR